MQELQFLFDQNTDYQIVAAVQFGMPSKNCRNFGVCYIDPLNHKELALPIKESIFSQGLAIIKLVDEKCFEFSFLHKSLSNATKEVYFKNQSFLVMEAFRFPKSVAKDFGYHQMVIQPGNYSFVEDASILTVTFNKILLCPMQDESPGPQPH